MAFDLQKEAQETQRLIDVFKEDYVGGKGDSELVVQAGQIMTRLHAEASEVKGNSILESYVEEAREDFLRYVKKVCTSSHKPKLEQFWEKKQQEKKRRR